MEEGEEKKTSSACLEAKWTVDQDYRKNTLLYLTLLLCQISVNHIIFPDHVLFFFKSVVYDLKHRKIKIRNKGFIYILLTIKRKHGIYYSGLYILTILN